MYAYFVCVNQFTILIFRPDEFALALDLSYSSNPQLGPLLLLNAEQGHQQQCMVIDVTCHDRILL